MAKQEEGTPFDITQRVTVYSTDKDKNHTTGDYIEVGALVAEDLIKNGFATADKPKPSKTKE
jgi:hypothetical protein